MDSTKLCSKDYISYQRNLKEQRFKNNRKKSNFPSQLISRKWLQNKITNLKLSKRKVLDMEMIVRPIKNGTLPVKKSQESNFQIKFWTC